MRLIDADELLEKVHNYYPSIDYLCMSVPCVKLRDIKSVPTIEAELVKHGHIVTKSRVLGGVKHYKCPECSYKWQENKRQKVVEYLCSECGKVLAENYHNFCPNCGAKMDGDNDDL